ncbi:DUF1566 domain-containing protein [Phytopseudomonas punonensis]|uniref:DUF1566 domain-containing protein n=1 Tax=Phytopseudomonas punonensis TaxID=1220495 RepID=A0A1M7LKN7_9GAMM|nr:DUF1566 domain-containing protein [Pseudomonas punonensis]SHM78698.1 hypothetical protein SAMN05216288_4294 [Pseudomonas punonensis]
MKPEIVTVKVGEINISAPSQLVIAALMAAAMGNVEVPTVSSPQVTAQAPGIGEYWPDQGGFNAGLIAATNDVPAHYLVVATEDIGDHAWGGRGKESAATSKLDGLANTEVLVKAGEHDAASAAANHEADGFNDFYLPAAGELYHCWLHVAELFNKDCAYWSSSQRSAYSAFTMGFDDGNQDLSGGKDDELRVRPVRRFFI